MLFRETPVHGAYLIIPELRADERGFFARVWCDKEQGDHKLTTKLAQASISFNYEKGTLRGLHYQLPPCQEVKIVTCYRGAIYDVVLDLRSDSPTYLKWAGYELTAENRHRLYVPEGCAHGFQTLADESEVLYLISHPYSANHARGVRHNDRALGIDWPLPVTRMSDADRGWPDYHPVSDPSEQSR